MNDPTALLTLVARGRIERHHLDDFRGCLSITHAAPLDRLSVAVLDGMQAAGLITAGPASGDVDELTAAGMAELARLVTGAPLNVQLVDVPQ